MAQSLHGRHKLQVPAAPGPGYSSDLTHPTRSHSAPSTPGPGWNTLPIQLRVPTVNNTTKATKHDPNKSNFEEMQAFKHRINAMEAQRSSDAKAFENTISSLKSEMEVKLKQHDLDYVKQVTELQSTISGLQDTVKDLVNYQLTTDPIYIVWIQIRTIVDKTRLFLYEILTGNTAAKERDRNHVKTWWATALNPSPLVSAAMDNDELDNYRYQTCLSLLVDKKLEMRPEYHNLVHSGALKFLSQASIQLRNQANQHAHEVQLDMASFRQVLHKTKSMHANLCSAEDFTCLNGILDFLEVVETQK